MGLFRKTSEFPAASPAAKRAAMLATHDLIPWAETCLYQVGRSLLEFQRSADLAHLGEATLATQTLDAIVREINTRAAEDVSAERPG